MRPTIFLSLFLGLAACVSDAPSESETEDVPIGALAQSPEPGVAGAASVVVVDYEGRLENGTVFDGGERILLPLAGMNAGFARGVAGMREGETKTFEVRPEEGYSQPPEGVPAGETLTYEVTLHEVR
ncbi:MAG: FKBP-type peptidyl-prolyl cis-trans isomerase [Bacteroidota bacterium]